MDWLFEEGRCNRQCDETVKQFKCTNECSLDTSLHEKTNEVADVGSALEDIRFDCEDVDFHSHEGNLFEDTLGYPDLLLGIASSPSEGQEEEDVVERVGQNIDLLSCEQISDLLATEYQRFAQNSRLLWATHIGLDDEDLQDVRYDASDFDAPSNGDLTDHDDTDFSLKSDYTKELELLDDEQYLDDGDNWATHADELESFDDSHCQHDEEQRQVKRGSGSSSLNHHCTNDVPPPTENDIE